MPCRDDRDSEPSRSAEVSVLNSELFLTKKKLNQVTRLLCYLCKHFSSKVLDLKISKELNAWYAKHDEFDKERLKKAKESALKKLTEDEKEALGLE